MIISIMSVCCVQSLREAQSQLQSVLARARADLKQIAALDRQIKAYSTSSSNP